jgi:peptidoglycan/xylan/chitin deacetylase (PgdA/CDA1 family)
LAVLSTTRAWQALGVFDVLEALGRGSAGRVHALMYHRVAEQADDPALYPGLISATPADFADQMEHVARHHHVVSPMDLLTAHAAGEPLPRRSVVITFDDGYADFADHAWPVLRRVGLPAALFVPTAFIGDVCRSFWWDRLWEAVRTTNRAETMLEWAGRQGAAPGSARGLYGQLVTRIKGLSFDDAGALIERLCEEVDPVRDTPAVLGWDELRKLEGEGLTVCPHTRTHPHLDRIPVETIRDEVAGSRHDLERELGASPPLFAYPDGAFGDAATSVLADEGIRLAFTTRRGVADIVRGQPLLLPRIPVTARTSLPVLRAQLLDQFAALGSVVGQL